jgi:hypothetical protein
LGLACAILRVHEARSLIDQWPERTPVRRQVNVRLGTESDFLQLIRLAIKAQTRRKPTASGRGLKTTHADALQTEQTSRHNEPFRRPADPRQTPWNKGKLSGSTLTENQGRLVDPDQASGGEAHPGFGHVHSSHRQQATRLRCGQPEGRRCGSAWSDRRSRHRAG